MSSVSGWQDPICYQFSFYAITGEHSCKELLDVYRAFVKEMIPFFQRWVELGGVMLSKIHRPMNGYLMNELRDEENLRQHFERLSELSTNEVDEIELSPFPSKVPRQYFTSARQLDKTWKETVVRLTDLKQIGTIGKEEKVAWLDYLLNCPSDDLRGFCFPQKCFIPGSTPFTLHYQIIDAAGTLAYAAELLHESGAVLPANNEQNTQYIHCIRISLPRYILDEMGEVFSFQEVWKERLEHLARTYTWGVGLIKMDCYTAGRCHPLLSGCGNFKMGFTKKIHDVGWGMSLTQSQVSLLGGAETLRNSKVFCYISEQMNGSIVCQLSPDISIIPQAKAKALWNLVSPHIDMVEYQMNSFANIPPSMRLGIQKENLDIDELGYYRFKKTPT